MTSSCVRGRYVQHWTGSKWARSFLTMCYVVCFCLFQGWAERGEGQTRSRGTRGREQRGVFCFKGKDVGFQKQKNGNRPRTTVKTKGRPSPSTSDVSWVRDRSSRDFGRTNPTRVLWTPTRDVLYAHIARSVRTMPSQYER